MAQKLPMNKIQVGYAPSPNLKAARSKIGSLDNATHKPGGGNVRIESRKVLIDAKPRIGARNELYAPAGGDKKIQTMKLQWNAKPKIGSLDNANHKPGGGDKKIETKKIEVVAKSKVGSLDNAKYRPGGGDKKIETRKLDFQGKSKVGSTANMKHVAGGGHVKIFDDKDYLKQRVDSRLSKTSSSKASSEGRASVSESPEPSLQPSELSHSNTSTCQWMPHSRTPPALIRSLIQFFFNIAIFFLGLNSPDSLFHELF